MRSLSAPLPPQRSVRSTVERARLGGRAQARTSGSDGSSENFPPADSERSSG